MYHVTSCISCTTFSQSYIVAYEYFIIGKEVDGKFNSILIYNGVDQCMDCEESVKSL